MIVGLGIRLKSMSVRSWRWTSLRLPQNPRIATRVLLNRANLSFVPVCMWWQTHMAPCVFQLFFLPVFCWLCCILVPSLHNGWRDEACTDEQVKEARSNNGYEAKGKVF